MVSNELVLKAESRKEIGSKHAAKLRLQGKIPVTVYGHKQDPENITLNRRDFTVALTNGHRLFDIDIEGKKEKLLAKDVQYDYLGRDIIHADLIRVNLKEKVKITVPIAFKGVAEGTVAGGLIEEHLDSLDIECLVTDMPESIDVSIKTLKIGDSLHASDIVLPSGSVLVTDPSALVIACHEPKVEVEVEEGAEPASPEVITEKKQDDEEKSAE